MCEDKSNCTGSCDGHCEDGSQQGDCCCNQQHIRLRHSMQAETVVELEAYLADLKIEVQTVEEQLADLRK